jgi:nucleotide-binding universal stress UspA family protein
MIVIHGKPAHEIVSLASQEMADIIVIATQGESGWQRFVFGSVAEKVVRHADCPVLTIRAPNPEEK